MRVIVINPWNQSISEAVKHPGYRDYYRLLSGPTVADADDSQVTCFDITMLTAPADNLLIVDDNGLLNSHQAFFQLDGRTFAGRAVLIGNDDSEEDCQATASIEEVAALVQWVPLGATVTISRPKIHSFATMDDMLRFLGHR
jgi:hypothetical protein